MTNIINEFINELLYFEKVIVKRFEIKSLLKRPPLEFRNGDLDGYKYFFHGAGCTFFKRNVKFNFDMHVYDEELMGAKDYYISISSYAIWEYINTSEKYQKFYANEGEVKKEMDELKEKGMLKDLVIGGRIYYSYVLNKDWYNSLIVALNHDE